jgi:hypothetical protein
MPAKRLVIIKIRLFLYEQVPCKNEDNKSDSKKQQKSSRQFWEYITPSG